MAFTTAPVPSRPHSAKPGLKAMRHDADAQEVSARHDEEHRAMLHTLRRATLCAKL
jgi:hypothetical protein